MAAGHEDHIEITVTEGKLTLNRNSIIGLVNIYEPAGIPSKIYRNVIGGSSMRL